MLQGSLENFALDEVLGLLAGTTKTGHLEIAGNRGTGKLTFNDGRLVDGTASYTANGTDLEDVMFELLRYDDGTFSFIAGEVQQSDKAENVATILASAEHRLRDWRSIESIVPTLKHQVSPSLSLPGDEVTIDRAEWATLIVIASGCPVSLVCDKLDLGEVEGSRRIKNLAERELVTVTEPIGGYVAASRGAQSSAEPPAPPASANGPDASFPADGRHVAGTMAAPEASPTVALSEVPAPPAPVASADAEAASLAPAVGIEGKASGSEAPSVDAPAFDAPASDLSADSSGVHTTDRPPMPPAPAADQLQTDGPAPSVPPAPPSPAEISSFSEELRDASELQTESEDAKSGGLLARYLKSDD